MTDDTIEPALTSDEWERWLKPRERFGGARETRRRDLWEDAYEQEPMPAHATAALCLWGQPFGFDHDDVDRIRRHAAHIETRFDDPDDPLYDDGALYDDMRKWRNLAARIKALLPPREEGE